MCSETDEIANMQTRNVIAGHFIVLTFHCCQFDYEQSAQDSFNGPECPLWRTVLTSFAACVCKCEPNCRTPWQLVHKLFSLFFCFWSGRLRRRANTPNYFIYRVDEVELHHHRLAYAYLIITNWMHDQNRSRQWIMELLRSRSTIVILWSIILCFIGEFAWHTPVSIKISRHRETKQKKLLSLRTDGRNVEIEKSPINLTYWNVFVYMFSEKHIDVMYSNWSNKAKANYPDLDNVYMNDYPIQQSIFINHHRPTGRDNKSSLTRWKFATGKIVVHLFNGRSISDAIGGQLIT